MTLKRIGASPVVHGGEDVNAREARPDEYPRALGTLIKKMAKVWIIPGVSIVELPDGKTSVVARFLGPNGDRAWGCWVDSKWREGQILRHGEIARSCNATQLKALVSPARVDAEPQEALF